MAKVSVRVQGGQQLKTLTAQLKASGRVDLQRNLRREIREAGRLVVGQLRGAVMAVKVTSTKGGTTPPVRSTGLRLRTARAVGISTTRKGVKIRVSAQRFGPYGVTLPRYLDADLKRWVRWRHPVFHPGPIGTAPPRRVVQQKGQPYFFRTIRRNLRRFEQAVLKAMDDTERELFK